MSIVQTLVGGDVYVPPEPPPTPPTLTLVPSSETYNGTSTSHTFGPFVATAGDGGSISGDCTWTLGIGTLPLGAAVSAPGTTGTSLSPTVNGVPADSTQYYATVTVSCTLFKAGWGSGLFQATAYMYFTRTP
jgi:hypothetical protein